MSMARTLLSLLSLKKKGYHETMHGQWTNKLFPHFATLAILDIANLGITCLDFFINSHALHMKRMIHP
jgi:hypothetical protein